MGAFKDLEMFINKRSKHCKGIKKILIEEISLHVNGIMPYDYLTPLAKEIMVEWEDYEERKAVSYARS